MNCLRIFTLACITIAACLVYGCIRTNSQHQQEKYKALGINANERLAEIKQEDIKRTNTTWARGFLEFFDMYPDVETLESDSNVIALGELKKNGYKRYLTSSFNSSLVKFRKQAPMKCNLRKNFLQSCSIESGRQPISL